MLRLLLICFIPLSCAMSAEDDGVFQKKVWPILQEQCIRCHGAERQKGHLRLDSRAAILAGGKTGPAAVTGKPDDSLLIKAVRYTDDDLKMPPKKQLSDDQISVLSDWIKRGMPWPADTDGKTTPEPGSGVKDAPTGKPDPTGKP